MTTNNGDPYNAEVQGLVQGCRDIFAGHSNQVVLHALAGLLSDALDTDFFEERFSLPDRIEKIMSLMTALVTKLAEEDPTGIHLNAQDLET
jgi:hypothetical protein